MNMDLSGRVTIVTGGGTGIGAATARLLARHGAEVVIASRTASELERMAASDAASYISGQTLAVEGGPNIGGISDI